MICPQCTTETHLDGSCPSCKSYAKQASSQYAEGNYLEFSDLSERERAAFTRIYGDVVPCVK